jgi:hypothetical protein
MKYTDTPTLKRLFPEGLRVLLTGGGREFIEQVGIEAARDAVLHVLMGGNLRDRTEPLTRRRIAMISGGLVALFARGQLQVPNFTDNLSEMAVEEIQIARSDKAAIWLAQWLIGLTGKSVQNVLKSDRKAVRQYVTEFDAIIDESAIQCREVLGDLEMILNFSDGEQQKAVLDWEGVTRLTTAIGSQTLTIRGSNKAMYGKLFEKLVLGSVLTILGFERVEQAKNTKTHHVFWLSDSSSIRESDATLIFRPGKVARFDIGFIGPGNSEISKDKLSRYAREYDNLGGASESVTFIVVDRLPKTGKTETAARNIGAEIIQMSLQFWPRYLARRLHQRLGFEHELLDMPDKEVGQYLAQKLETIPILDFLSGVSMQELMLKESDPAEEYDVGDDTFQLGLFES